MTGPPCGSTAQAQFTSEAWQITQSGTSDSIAVAFCGGLVLNGSANGDVLSLQPSGDTSIACTQSDSAGNTITINDFPGGSFTFDGSNLDASIEEDVQINGLSCNGK